MKYCGICHTDIHVAKGDLGPCVFPCVPGHELAGVVAEVGSKVTKVKVGDKVGVGCMVDSCRDCENCKEGDEQYCLNGNVMTYNGQKKHKGIGGNPKTQTFGGYTKSYTVTEHFCIKLPDNLDLSKAGPLLCAGITMYEPLRVWGATKGKKMTIGIIGVGGLGTMGIKLAKALGHTVVAISRSADKEAMSKEKGADRFVVSTNAEQMAGETKKMDLILNTISANHDCNIYLPLLRKDGTLVQLGAAGQPHQISQIPLMFSRTSLAGSLIGGVKPTEEMIEFCSKHQIYPDVEMVDASGINKAWESLANNKDGVRYVIDIEKSLQNKDFLPAL
uniref:Enoyl reductase (ER) domain-containing protein n=1 Tax=Strombidium rassoulzadegani TaxID=1082188 RepID=A0A7S3FWS8_9SPIT|mmetsp:Transcript_888/g.1599  ORF Transcript_888/g.1599 Transcript_888/m.1599 type:complete len:332 (+) Transcript_888:186-1181(+)